MHDFRLSYQSDVMLCQSMRKELLWGDWGDHLSSLEFFQPVEQQL